MAAPAQSTLRAYSPNSMKLNGSGSGTLKLGQKLVSPQRFLLLLYHGRNRLLINRAPMMKWGLAAVTFSQFQLPPEKISWQSNLALMCTGVIWTRWSLIIKPKNYLLAGCNAFLGTAAATQLGRLYFYNQEQKRLVKSGEKVEVASASS